MSVKSKLKKNLKSSRRAEEKLLKLVSKKAKKKEILGQVDRLQELMVEESKLSKKLKKSDKSTPKSKDRAPKTAKKEKAVKETKVKAVAPKKTKSVAKNSAAPQIIVEVPARQQSTSFNSKDAMREITGMLSEEEINAFIAGDTRTTVLNRAKSRVNALAIG